MTVSITNVYWSRFQLDDWQMYIAKTDEGVCYIGTPNAPFSELETWINKKIPDGLLIETDEALEEDIAEVNNYLQGIIDTFTVALHPVGTDFQKKVWQALQTIPYGNTKTYSDIAEQINRPTAIRAVATAVGANPLLMMIPCHRVVAKNGGLAGFRAGLDMKKALLELESNVVNDE